MCCVIVCTEAGFITFRLSWTDYKRILTSLCDGYYSQTFGNEDHFRPGSGKASCFHYTGAYKFVFGIGLAHYFREHS